MHTPNKQDVWKFTAGRSQRMTFAEQMKHRWDLAHEKSDADQMDHLKWRFEHQCSADTWLALTSYYYDMQVIAWDAGAGYGRLNYGGTTNIGNCQQGGFEVEFTYQREQTKVMLSHGYTKLIDFQNNPGVTNIMTAKPFGYGDDLANWSNHITKLVLNYSLDDQWTLSGNGRIYWGFPGARDYASYLTDKNSPYSREPGYDKPYGPSIFVGLGLQYQPSKNLTFRLNGHDLVGLIDKKYNKTLYGFNSFGDYRSSAPAVSLAIQSTF
jgi:hypothetical protein